MQMTQHECRIQSYDDTQIVINDVTYRQTIVVTMQDVIDSWPITDVDQLETSQLNLILEQQPEIVLIGTGAVQKIVNSSIQNYFAQHNLGIEIMSTGAACRTFNILISENRQVAAILIIS